MTSTLNDIPVKINLVMLIASLIMGFESPNYGEAFEEVRGQWPCVSVKQRCGGS